MLGLSKIPLGILEIAAVNEYAPVSANGAKTSVLPSSSYERTLPRPSYAKKAFLLVTVDPATMATVVSFTGLGGLERGVVNAPVLFEAVQRENLISPWLPIERSVLRLFI